jgi:hypothetical protein
LFISFGNYQQEAIGTREKKRREKKPSHAPSPLSKRKGKRFREDAEILIYKGRANHYAD